MDEIPAAPGGWVINRPDYYVGFFDSIPVPENKTVLLMTFLLMAADSDPKLIYFGVPQNPVREDFLILDGGPGGYAHQAINPVSGDLAMPVFGINTQVLPATVQTYGTVKALYR